MYTRAKCAAGNVKSLKSCTGARRPKMNFNVVLTVVRVASCKLLVLEYSVLRTLQDWDDHQCNTRCNERSGYTATQQYFRGVCMNIKPNQFVMFAIKAPTWDVENGILRAWWLDPMTATVSFAVFTYWFWYEERKRGLSRDSDFFNASYYGAVHKSMLGYWMGIYIWKCIVPPSATRTIPDGMPTNMELLVYLMAEVVSGILLYDAWFFFLHWAMHEVPSLRTWHARHHSHSSGVESRDVLRHSLLDGSMQVLVNIMVQQRTPWGASKSRCARALHNVLVVGMLTESHTASPVPNIFRRWFVGVRDHRLHHLGALKTGAYGKHHRYQQFFGYLDDARAWYSNRNMKFKKETSTAGKETPFPPIPS
jgi:sterol desaturase/sphingolipid hydroxylase (fatty acid hydroxylase superfamily)